MDPKAVTIPAPIFYGLAKDRAAFPLPPEWAVEAQDLIVDTTGKVSARKGWTPLNSSTIESGANILQVHEYINASGTSEIISSTAANLYSGTTTPTSKTGALTPSAGNWKFINFNGKCLGWQASHTPIAYTGSGNFANISVSTGTLPDGNAACAAFGRVWAVDDDGQTIRYCALLDETKWAAADGGGLIDMRTVWTQGMDVVVAIVAFGSRLVVFGKRHIIIWQDGSGSQLGLNPLNMYVTDTIDNVGAVSRDAVVVVGEIDVVFWSYSGIRSVIRTLQERATPVNDLSPANRNYIATGVTAGTASSVRAAYSPLDGLVMFIAPVRSKIFVLDVRQQIPEGGYRMFEWNLAPKALAVTLTSAIYFGFPGDIGHYTGSDDDGAAFTFLFESGWVDMKGEDGQRQALKAMKFFAYTENTQAVNLRWNVDFETRTQTKSVTIGSPATVAEWNVGEWGIGEFGPSGAVYQKRVPLSREAEFFKLQVSTSIDGYNFAVQPITIYSRPLRIA